MLNLLQFVQSYANNPFENNGLSILENFFPCNLYMKDRKGKYLFANTHQVKDLELEQTNDIIGYTDFDVCKTASAFSVKQNDEAIIAKGKSKIFIEPVILHNGRSLTAVSYKAPLYSKNNQIIGIYGLSLLDYNQAFSVDQPAYLSKYNKKIFLSKIDNNISKREKEVLYWLIQGKTARGIGQKLNLSCRTVEAYLVNIKNKLQVSTKYELIEKIMNYLM